MLSILFGFLDGQFFCFLFLHSMIQTWETMLFGLNHYSNDLKLFVTQPLTSLTSTTMFAKRKIHTKVIHNWSQVSEKVYWPLIFFSNKHLRKS